MSLINKLLTKVDDAVTIDSPDSAKLWAGAAESVANTLSTIRAMEMLAEQKEALEDAQRLHTYGGTG